MTPEEVRKIIREELWFIMKGNDKLNFSLPIQIADGRNMSVGKTTGTQIGTESTQKLSVYGVTPVIQQSSISSPTGGATIDSQARSAIDSIRTVLTTFGITA